MGVIELEEGPTPCPESIVIIGGGRWARVIVDVLKSIVPNSVVISVHSFHNTKGMASWLDSRGLSKRIQLSSEWPRDVSADQSAVIVANAARDHQVAAEWAISRGVPVLVEKPIALTAAAAQRLTKLAHDGSIRVAAANVFLFARYLANFSKLIENAGVVQSLNIDWTDPVSETRYGEHKRYDSSLPIFSDWLPHAVPIAGALLSGLPSSCRGLELHRGGAALKLELMANGIPCIVHLERNSDQRQRIVQAVVGEELLELDFSIEPGVISRGSSTRTGDQYWGIKRGPAGTMLVAFLKWAAGGEYDGRLDIGLGLQACKISEQVLEMYRSAQQSWLISKLAAPDPKDKSLIYALGELIQTEGPLPTSELKQQINAVLNRFSGVDSKRWLDELSSTQNVPRVLRSRA